MLINEAFYLGIKKLNNSEESSLKVKLLISSILGVSKEYILIHMEDEFPIEKQNEYLEKIERLAKGEPIQYIINNQNFFGRDFYVDENVLIPQPDTEILLEETLKICNDKNLEVLDLCTGSGIIAVTLACENENLKLTASDISKKALEVAKKNAIKHNVKIDFIESDLFENINKKFDIIVSNPPYIETETIRNLSEEVKREPILALDGGEDGLKFYREIAKKAKEYLSPEGYLIVEIGYNQKESVIKIFKENNFKDIICIKDYSQNDRVIIGKL